MTVPPVLDIAELDPGELAAAVEARGHPVFHAKQVYRWIHRRGVTGFHQMTDLPLALRAALARDATVTTPAVADMARSIDGTAKALLDLADGRRIESVFIPDTPAQTICVSTQVGCAMGCVFCLTGKMGLLRHLTAGEIVGQVRVLTQAFGLVGRRFNIVLMGMGEPLHNYEPTLKALRMLAAPDGLAVSPRRVTLSTIGLVPALERLAREPLMPNVAISLHGTTQAQRAALVPPGTKHTLADVIDAAARLPVSRQARLTFEYVLLKGVNDSPADAQRLARLVGHLRARVNLIPLNEAPGIPFDRPADEDIDRFGAILARHGLTVSVRKSRGRDIRAACGQLIIEGRRPSTAQQLAALL